MDVQVLVGVLVGIVGVAGALLVVVAATAGRFAREGRGEEHLLVAPRGARFGDATDLVLAAARAQEARAREDRAVTVVRLDEHRRRREAATGHAA